MEEIQSEELNIQPVSQEKSSKIRILVITLLILSILLNIIIGYFLISKYYLSANITQRYITQNEEVAQEEEVLNLPEYQEQLVVAPELDLDDRNIYYRWALKSIATGSQVEIARFNQYVEYWQYDTWHDYLVLNSSTNEDNILSMLNKKTGAII